MFLWKRQRRFTIKYPLPRKQGSRISMLNFNGCLMFMSDVLAKVSASRELFISQTLRQSFFIDNQCVKSKSKQTCFSCLFAAVDVAQGRLPLGTGWAGQDWLLTSRRPQKHKVRVGFFQFDLQEDLYFYFVSTLTLLFGARNLQNSLSFFPFSRRRRELLMRCCRRG